MSRHSPHMTVMIKAAQKAARTLVRDFGEVEHLQVSKKGPADFVSAADIKAEESILEVLKEARPDYGFVCEESGVIEGKADARFIIDPLDGTTNFLHGLPHWCISIALEEKGEITHGLVFDPIKDEMFVAEKGKGSFVRRGRLRVSGRVDPLTCTVVTGAPRASKEKKERFLREYTEVLNLCPSLRRSGSAALDLAYVAAGRYDAFWERELNIWDVAAGVLIVKEAGGFIQDLDKRSADPLVSGNILAATELMLAPMQKALKSAA